MRSAAAKRPDRAARFWARLAAVRENRALLILALLLVIFVALAFVAKSPLLRHGDVAVTRALQRSAFAPLVAVAKFFTALGNGGPLALMVVLVGVPLLRTRRPLAAALAGLTILGHPLNYALKEFIRRPRPSASDDSVLVLLPALGTSFPSGHAMTATLFFGFLAFLASVHIRRRRVRRFWVTTAVLLAVCVSVSRVYLGAHFLSDIVGGAAAGLFFLLLWAELYKIVGARELAPPA